MDIILVILPVFDMLKTFDTAGNFP